MGRTKQLQKESERETETLEMSAGPTNKRGHFRLTTKPMAGDNEKLF
jgi:hypothetical protein